MPSDITDMRNISFKDEQFYFCSSVVVGQETVPAGGGDIGIYGHGPATGSDLVIYEETVAEDTEASEEEAAAEETGTEEETTASEPTSAPEADVLPMPVPEEEYTYDVYATRIFKVNLDGSGLEQLPDYASPEVPEGAMGSVDISAMSIDGEGNIWVIEQGSFYHYDEQGNYIDDGRTIGLRKLGSTGAELSKIDLSGLLSEEEYFYVSGLALDVENNIYFSDGNQKVYVYTSAGAQKCKLELDSWVNSMVILSNGTVAAMTYENENNVLKPIDAAAGVWKDGIKLPMQVYNAYTGAGDYLVFYSDGNNLYGLKEGQEEPEKLFNWINCDIDGSSVNSLSVLPDGRFACLTYSYNYEGSSGMEMAVLTKTDASLIPEKTYLSMATFYMDYTLRAKVIEFNKTNGKYRIEVTDYSEYNTEDDYQAGLIKLSTEIISGKVPDLICTSQQLPMHQYIAKGLLEDLYPYIDNDPELGRDKLVQEVFKALENDGKLYEICSNFSIYTVVGDPNRIGSEPGWTLDEMNQILGDAPEGTTAFVPYIVRNDILQTSFTMNMEEYVNWNTGECKFDSPGFIKLLEFAKTFPETFEWEEGKYIDEMQMIQTGELLMHIMYMYDFNEYQMYKAMFGGNIVFKGFPCESKNGNAYMVNAGLAMSSQCKNKDGAWEFMRLLLTEDYQQQYMYWGFPTNKAVFDEKVKEAMTPYTYIDENGVEVEEPKNSWYMGDTPIEVYAMTQAELDQFMELLRNTDRVMNYDTSIMDIINTETGAFFAGQKTAADVARIIQSRVGTYVNEQR
jgi:ABC-type glycerol-3-phosphate transport system substrate-binding protein